LGLLHVLLEQLLGIGARRQGDGIVIPGRTSAALKRERATALS
jgi:hypothetical protein